MSRKGENIHKRKDGRWEARAFYFDIEGKRKYKSLYAKTYREAKEKLLRFLTLENNQDKLARKENHLLIEVIEEWFAANQMKQKASTQLKYQTMINNHILPELGNKKISEIDAFLLNAFLLKKLDCGSLNGNHALSPSYVRTMGIILTSIIDYAVKMGYCKAFKTKIVKPYEPRPEITVMELDAQKKLEQALKHDYSGTSIGVMLALNAGLRIGEVCALKWDDIDLQSAIIQIRHSVSRIKNKSGTSAKTMLVIDHPKTNHSNRDIPINSKLLEYLKEAKKEASSVFVISTQKSFLSPRTFEYRFHKLLAAQNIENTNFHALRHTFATRCVELGVDIKTLSEVLGHANVGITLNTYVHSSIDLKRSQIEKLALLGAS